MADELVSPREGYMAQALLGLLRTMRPKQWTKNVPIFAGLVFDGQLLVPSALIRVCTGFALLCLVASSIYIINDLVDIESDRQHPQKRHRPLPSGQLPVPLAIGAAITLPVLALGTAALVLQSLRFTIILICYLILHILYSFSLKNIVLLDILAVTAGFVLRVAAGVMIIQVENFSPWLYVCSSLLALFLVVGKRRQELSMLGEKAGQIRVTYKDYTLPLLDDILRIVTTSTLIAYILYTIEAPTRKLAEQNMALLTVPFVMYALFRYLYLIHVKGEGSAPDEVLLSDRPLQLAIALWGFTFVVLLYFIPR